MQSNLYNNHTEIKINKGLSQLLILYAIIYGSLNFNFEIQNLTYILIRFGSQVIRIIFLDN